MAQEKIVVVQIRKSVFDPDEFECRAYAKIDGKMMRYAAADYFTSDMQDAWGTALAMLDNGKAANEVVYIDKKRRDAWVTTKI